MGKKRKFDSSSSIGNQKIVVNYMDLPEIQKPRWILGANLDLLDEFINLLDWLCDWGKRDGFEFEGIKTLKHVHGHPCVEVEIVYLEKSNKFLISRASLYILAFYGVAGWRKFQDKEFDIDMGVECVALERGANYHGKPWKTLGLKAMVDGLEDMNSPDDNVASNGCEVFAVHLCEASRIRLVRLMIARTMIPSISSRWEATLGDDELIPVGSAGCSDVISSLTPFTIDMEACVVDAPHIEGFIMKFKQLSKAWMVYSLSQRVLFPLEERIADMCGIKFRKTLRHSLSVLSGTNLEKIAEEWSKKFRSGRCPRDFTESHIKFMESKVRELR